MAPYVYHHYDRPICKESRVVLPSPEYTTRQEMSSSYGYGVKA